MIKSLSSLHTLPLCYCWILIVTDFCHQTLFLCYANVCSDLPPIFKVCGSPPSHFTENFTPWLHLSVIFFFFLACNDTVQSQLSPPTYFILFLDFSESNLLPLSMLCIELLLKAVDEYILSVLQLEIMCRKNFHCLIPLP